ncbi:hypothetical protein OXX80_001434 [Metschnikowia pulcherrima]
MRPRSSVQADHRRLLYQVPNQLDSHYFLYHLSMATNLFGGSQKGNYEPVPESDPTTSVQMDDLGTKSYEDEFCPEQSFRFNATPYVQQQTSEPFEYKDFVPYKLKLEKTGLFSEFYFHFKRAFSLLSTENRAYCSVDLEKLRSSYVGSQQDIESSVIRVENDFDQKFRQCLDPKLLKEFPTWTFTRACVETEFREKLREYKDYTSYPNRMNKLMQRARLDDAVELIDFLMAFEHSESSIWQHVLLVFSKFYLSETRKQFFNSKVEFWQNQSGPVSRRVQGFVKELRDEGIGMSQGDKIYVLIARIAVLLFIFGIIVIASSQ